MYTFQFISLSELGQVEYKGEFPSCQYKWIKDWYSVFKNVENNVIGYKKKPYIIAAYANNTLVAIVPLVKLCRVYCRCIHLEFIEFLDQQWSSMGNDIISVKSLQHSFVDELIHWIEKNINYHFIFLKYLPKSTILKEKYKMYHYSGIPFIPISKYQDYQDFRMRGYKKRFRKQLDRTYRKIERDGFSFDLSFEDVNETNFEDIKRISRTKKLDGKGFLYGDSKKEEFYLKLFKHYSSKVVLVKFNNQPVAYVVNIECNGVRIGVDCAFDREYRTYGVGIQCMNGNIKHSFTAKNEQFSFGDGLDPYKFQFTHCAEPLYMCFDFKYSFKSLLALPFLMYLINKKDKEVYNQLQKVDCNE
nr:GNAT family N-acetyltransferase [uncultured Marinifilum sp.]